MDALAAPGAGDSPVRAAVTKRAPRLVLLKKPPVPPPQRAEQEFIPIHKDWMLAMLLPAEDLGGALPSSFPEALTVYEQASKAGDAVACAGMGTLYLFGWGVAQNYALAREYFMAARNRTHPRGFAGMGVLASYGWGGEPLSHSEAANMFQAAGSEPVALYESAMASLHRRGRALDWEYVFAKVEHAAKLGYAVALYQLGSFYHTGTPMQPHDHERAVAVLGLASQMGFERADDLIAEVRKVMWSGDVEGQIRLATMEAKRISREASVEEVVTQRHTSAAEAEEARGDALDARIVAEKAVLKQMRALLLRTMERAAAEVVRAEIAEADLTKTKAELALVKERVEEEKERIKKLKARAEFLLKELRRQKRFHVGVGGRWEGEWVPHSRVGDAVTATAVPLQFTRRWTCCDCTNKYSFFCKPFCGCGNVTEQHCEEAPVVPGTIHNPH